MKKNIFFSMLSTGTNYVLPLLIIPYCIAGYGLEGYGVISLALALTSIIALITQLNLENIFASLSIEKCWSKVIEIVTIKLTFFIVSSVVIYLLLLLFINESSNIFLLGGWPLIFCVLNVNYFFIAKQNFKIIFLLNIISKLCFTILVFIFIYYRLPTYLVVMGMNGWYITSSLIGFIILRREIINEKQHEYVNDISVNKVLLTFKQILPGFSSSLASLFLTMLVQPFMAIVTNNNYNTIAIYSICDKIIRAATGFLDSINNVLYSKISDLNSIVKKNKIVSGVLLIYVFIEMIGGVITVNIYPYMTNYISKLKQFPQIEGLLFLIIPIIVVITVGNILSSLVLFTSGLFKQVTYAIILSSITFMLFVFIPYSDKGAEYFLFALLCSEGISTCLKVWLTWKKTKYFR
ncbi:oligosaccharide flippase family protein [Citrobacter portucalensis]|uniref:Putative O-antigen transporter n=2 Tax=Citrobacter portucalensis TaxID=1639133 RepID=A0ABD5GZR8_9ENTR|nr:oligosaccharide flippase family protein [Citrobacter portucalensis]MBJ8706700.1 oligosaccharide flippase family protein [Citrobacter freundii]MDK2579256.1 oligosaccharide flippase family protein [Citrobacter portucalensis]MDW2634676.1 oligosaccharide flippase family protein [Citrobacter portucalensis]